MNLRRSVLSSGAAFVALAMSCPAFAQERSFDIPAQPAVRAIPELARQAQVQIVAPARDLEGIRTPAVKGRMDVRTALRRLIAGTPLRIDTDDGQIITLRSAGKGAALRKKAGERVEVGVIVGRVIDPATGEYKRDAIIRLITAAGERQTVASNEGGEFRILDVPTGSAKVTVSFTGYADQASAVQVIAGKTVTLDFALLAPGEEARGPEIVVTGGREGDARAIMSQRRSMNITNNLSSESFGEVSEGNVGEFLKFMPGVVTQNQGGADDTVRYVGLRGLPPEYTSVDRRGKRTPVAG